MNLAPMLCNLNCLNDESLKHQSITSVILKIPVKTERKILKVFLLGYFYKLFYELFQDKIRQNQNNKMEYFEMDNKIIQFMIQSIVDSEEYTLEGIALYTRIPFDVIFDAACGNSNQLSATLWAKVVDLFLQVRPDVAQLLIAKLLEIKDKSCVAFSLLLNEM